METSAGTNCEIERQATSSRYARSSLEKKCLKSMYRGPLKSWTSDVWAFSWALITFFVCWFTREVAAWTTAGWEGTCSGVEGNIIETGCGGGSGNIVSKPPKALNKNDAINTVTKLPTTNPTCRACSFFECSSFFFCIVPSTVPLPMHFSGHICRVALCCGSWAIQWSLKNF